MGPSAELIRSPAWHHMHPDVTLYRSPISKCLLIELQGWNTSFYWWMLVSCKNIITSKHIYICIFVLWRSWEELIWLAITENCSNSLSTDNVFLLLAKYSPCCSQSSRLVDAVPGLHMHLQSSQLLNQLDTPTCVSTVCSSAHYRFPPVQQKYNKPCWLLWFKGAIRKYHQGNCLLVVTVAVVS